MIRQHGPRCLQRLYLFSFGLGRANFYRDLAEMFRRADPMLAFLEGEITNAQRTGQRSKIVALRRILDRLQTGANAGRVGHLLEDVMPSSDAMMLMGVDRAANKSAALEALAEAVDHKHQMYKVVWGYAALPALMLPLCFALIIILGDIVMSIESSTPVYVQKELWQGFNGLARTIAQFTSEHGAWLVISFTAILCAVGVSLPRWCGPVRLKLESWPIFSLYRDFQSGLLFISVALLLKTGSTLKGALEDLSQGASLWMRWHLRRVLHALDDDPNAILESFGRGLLSPYIVARAATLSRTAPTFSDVLIELGTHEGPRVLARLRATAMVANAVTVGVIGLLACVMGLASITVPGRFATLMQPMTSLSLKAAYEAQSSPPSGRK